MMSTAAALTDCSSEVRVMNLRKSSQPDETETVEVLALLSTSVAFFRSLRRPAMVPAVKGMGRGRGRGGGIGTNL